MLSITIEGETLDDVLIRCRGLYEALTGRPAPVVGEQPVNAPAPSEPEADPPRAANKTGKRGKARAVDAQDAPQTDVPSPDDEGENEFDAVAAPGLKEAALDKIRAVYALGSEGMEAVKKLGKDYNVKKLGDVPLDKAEALLKDIEKIEKKLAKDSPV